MHDSQLLTFIDLEHHFSLQLFNGQKILTELSIIHPLGPSGLSFFRKSILSFAPLISLTKQGETIGIYVDSDDPYFLFKFEANSSGLIRTLLLPENFHQFPETVSGRARLTKKIGQNAPYNSVVQIQNCSPTDLVHQIFKLSYQFSSKIIVSDKSDHSLLISQLPGEKIYADSPEITMGEYLLKNKKAFLNILDQENFEIESIHQEFEKMGIKLINVRNIKLSCGCSLEKILTNLYMLQNSTHEDIFIGKENLEIKCDYCKKVYLVGINEFTKFQNQQNLN
jgi:molecular chaperone Hsp33